MNFYNPVKIIFGCGTRSRIFDLIKSNNSILICSKSGSERINNDSVLNKIQNKITQTIILDSSVNLDILKLIKLTSKIDVVVAIGGGSIIDSSKIIHYLNNSQSKLICVPTTAGSGSEVTPYATAWDYNNHKKIGFTDLYANIAIVDPELTYNLPQKFRIISGLDAMNQAFESIWNINNSIITEPLATKAIQLGLSSINNLENLENKVKLCLMSLMSGLCISQTKTSLCHSISYPLTLHYNIPHGLACSFTMPFVFEFNSRYDDGRLLRIVKNILGVNSTYDDMFQILVSINKKFKITKTVKDMIISEKNLIGLISEMKNPARFENNMIKLNDDDIIKILKDSWNLD